MTQRLSILIYHRVLAAPDPLLPGVPDAGTFDRHLGVVKRLFRVMPLAEACARLAAGSLPARAACITFDDGYADNAEIALPLLLKHGLGACFFIASGYLDGGVMWNDRITEHVRACRGACLDLGGLGLGPGRWPIATPAQKAAAIVHLQQRLKYLPYGEREQAAARLAPPHTDLMLSAGQLCQLRDSGMEIGGHTLRHPILACLPDAEARAEIVMGKRMLESLLDQEVALFAYPNGKPGQDYDTRHVRMVEAAGFRAAVTTAAGVGRPGQLLELPRYTPWQAGRGRYALGLMHNLLRG
ncbi:polysaccharide deacetylase family protein [Oxalobacteraceae bacterium A2-2]